MSTAPPAPNSGTGGEESSALFAELDALLERMLALPVSYREEPESPGSAEPPPPRDLPPLITIAEATPEAVEVYTAPPPPVAFVNESLPPQPALDPAVTAGFRPADPPASSEPIQPQSTAPLFQPSAPPPASESAGYKPAATEEPTPPADESLTSSLEPPLPFLLLPLFWVTRCFDRCTVPLGAPGRWLRGPTGKSLLGWVGLLLLAVVGGIALHDWFGWTW